MAVRFKGTVSRDRHFNRFFLCMRDGLQSLSKAFHYPVQLLTFYLQYFFEIAY
jgi:hypothetical protein